MKLYGFGSTSKNNRKLVLKTNPLTLSSFLNSTFIFFININNLPQELAVDVKLFADDTLLFVIVNFGKASASALNSDLLKIQDCDPVQNIWNKVKKSR